MRLSDEILGENPGSWWRFLLVLIPSFAIYTLLIFFIAITAVFAVNLGWSPLISSYELNQGETALALFLMLLSLGLMHPVLALMMKIVYRRNYMSLFNPLSLPIRLQFKWGALYILLFLLPSELMALLLAFFDLGMDADQGYKYVWQVTPWLLWILPIAFATLLQSSAEEFVFRGFLQQYLARLIPIRWVYYVIPSALWASLHFGNMDGPLLKVAVVINIFALGLIFADWADRSQSLAGPVMAHFLNNIILIALIGNTLETSELHIFRADLDALSDQVLAVYMIASIIPMAAVYWWMRDKITVKP